MRQCGLLVKHPGKLLVNKTFWSGKRVFLSGHTGFKGSWLSVWLQMLGAKVTGLALDPPSTPNMFDVVSASEGMQSYIGDIRDLAVVKKAMMVAKPDIVIHMAAQALVRYSYDNPVETYATNVMGTVHVLEAARQVSSVKSIVVVTSDKCYENKEWCWGYRENEAMGGYDPYSNSKGCAELVTSAYRNSYFSGTDSLGLGSGRAGNVIGGGDWALDRLIPDIVQAFNDEREVCIRSPGAIRPWQHVLEPLHGYLTLAERLWSAPKQYSCGWNFGPLESDVQPVEWIVERMQRLWGEGAAWRLDAAEQPHEAHYLKLDCAKAHGELQWRPRLNLDVALQWTVEWYKAFYDGADIRQFTEKQIKEYMNEC